MGFLHVEGTTLSASAVLSISIYQSNRPERTNKGTCIHLCKFSPAGIPLYLRLLWWTRDTHTHTLVIWFAFHGRKHSASSNLWCACRIEVCAWQSRGPKWSGNYIRSSMCRLLKNKTETFPSRSLCCASFCLCESSLPCQEKDLEIKRRNAWKCHRSTSVIPMFNAPMHISVIHKVARLQHFLSRQVIQVQTFKLKAFMPPLSPEVWCGLSNQTINPAC